MQKKCKQFIDNTTNSNKKFCSQSCCNKNWNTNNKDKVRESNRLYYVRHGEKEKQRQREKYNNNPQYQTNYKKNRLKNDVQYALSHSLRRRLNSALKNNQKVGSAVKDLGCSVEELKLYLESQFESWMNWDNYGVYDHDQKTWHIDHIKSLSSFNLEDREELLKVLRSIYR